MNVLSQLAASLRASFAADTLERAEAYADEGRVATPQLRELEADWVEALAHVRGTRPTPYVVVLRAWPDERGGVEVETVCSCPVGVQCKHGAAVALVLGRTFGRRPAPTWQEEAASLLDDLAELAPPTDRLPAVALQVSLGRASPYHRSSGRPALLLRPLRPGRRQAWVKSGLGWSDVPRALVARSHDVEQLRVLERMVAAQRSQGWWHTPGGEVELEDVGRAAVALLREARDAGVSFVAVAPLTSVEVHDEALAVSVDVRAGEDGASLLDVGVAHPEGLWSGPGLTAYGDPAHSVSWVHEGRVVLAELERPLGGRALRVLRRDRPVAVPAGAGEQLTDLLRRIGTVAPLGSSDGSVEVPERARPRLRVVVTWEGAEAAEVAWELCYPGLGGPGAGEVVFGIDDRSSPPGVRDRAAEQRLLETVDPRPEHGRSRVEGVDVLHLALLELPAWRLVPDLEVVEHQPPDFREAEEAPEISFEAPDPATGDPAASGATDWLDLAVSIRIEGEPVPLPLLLAALTRGDEHVVLPSGLYVRLDRPELAALHDVVRAAAELHERGDDERVRVSRDDLGVWAQLDDVGEVDDRAAEWVRRARALRDLTELPRPEPRGIVSTLRDYQRDGFHWLAFLHAHDLGGILADEMGLGKTLQVLALVAHARADDPGGAPFLVVAPTSVVGAWASEAARHAPGLRVRTISATAARRGEAIDELAREADIVVTTYTLLRLEADAYAATAWSGLVLDEAQWIKNHRSRAYAAVRSIDAPFRLAVTGTPFENRLLELWSLLSVVTPGLYPQARSFLTHVVGPVEKDGDTAALRRFSRRIRPFVLRRSKELVAAELPPKQEQVLAVQLSPAHRRVYDTHLARERQRILGLVDDDFDGNRVAILAALTRLRQLALDPALVDPDHERIGSAKIDLLVDQLREVTAEGHRALVFSQFTGFLGRVRDRLGREDIATTYLDGRTQRRAEVVESFRAGDAPVFLISLKAGGVGLTLTEADYVFVLDPWWNPAAEAQAVDRAHRIGQQRAVMVYRLVSADTVEDKVMALKARKAALFAQVLDGEAGLSEAITADDVRALFD